MLTACRQIKKLNIELGHPILENDLDVIYCGIQQISQFGSRDVFVRVFSQEASSVEWMERAIVSQIQASLKLRSFCFPHIISAGRADGGELFVVTEAVTGQPLAEIISEFSLRESMNHCCSLFLPILDNLQTLHSLQGLPHNMCVHGRLNPRRIFFDLGSGRPVCVDSGIFKIHEAAIEQDPPLAFGDLPYMSPEQIDGKSLTPASDVFSLGLIFYEMMFGRRSELDLMPVELVVEKVQCGQHLDRGRFTQLQEPIAAVLAMALEVDTMKRLKNAGEFAERIRRSMHLISPPVSDSTLRLALPPQLKDEIPLWSLLKKG